MKEKIKQIIPIIIIFLVVIVLYIYIGCPIRFFTSLPCPGCGMCHSAYYLITGDINKAISYHPLIFVMPIALLLIIFRKKFSKGSQIFFLIIFVILFISTYILRFTNPYDNIVCIRWDLTLYHKLSTLNFLPQFLLS